MPVRTCDLGELARLVERRTSDAPRPGLVAIAGIETSGKSTLASLLADRVAGAAVLHTGTPLPSLDRAGWASSGRAAASDDPGSPTAAPRAAVAGPRVLIIEGGHTLPPGSDPTFDVRVWMDVSPNTAAGWGIDQRIREAKRRGAPPPYGSWHAFPPGGAQPDADRAAAEPPGDADVLFVPVSGMVPPIRIRFMTDAGCDFVLWDEENDHLGELEDLLPMPPELRAAVKAWADRCFRADGILRPSPHELDELRADGQRLSRELQEALGPDYAVVTRL